MIIRRRSLGRVTELHIVYGLCFGRRLLDGERWRQADIPPEVQRLTTSLEEGEFTL